MRVAGNGILVAVEGIDGAGKTTQVELLRKALVEAGETVVASKEPTDGRWGQIIRQSAQNGRMSLADELHAFISDRHEHIATKVRPALDRGEIVILDRYFYSTIAYQGIRGADVESLANDMRTQFPIPDAVLLIDTLPEVSLRRIAHSRGDVPNEFERLDALDSVRAIFNRMADSDPVIHKIDGHLGIEEVFQNAVHVLLKTALKAKRCAKSWDCDAFYCSYRENGECQWAELYPRLSAARAAIPA